MDDPLPPNVERLAAAPFSLDAARQRHLPVEPRGEAPGAGTPGGSLERRARRRPHLELVAGSAVPTPTDAQITDARDRFLSRLNRDRAEADDRYPVLILPEQPSMALLRRVARVLPWRDDGPRGA